MDNFLSLLVFVMVGMMLLTLEVTTGTFNHTNRGVHQTKNHPGKRNTKFIIPALISHMYHQKLEDSPLSSMLSKPFAKRVSTQENGKRESADSLEHRTIVGSPKSDERVRNVPKTKCPILKTKEAPMLIEVQSHRKNERHSNGNRQTGANIERGGNVIQVSKHFSPLSRNWYAGPPTMVWPPPVPYPNSYSMQLEQYPNPRFSRPLYTGSALQQEGFIQHIMGPARNKFSANNNLKDDDASHLVAQERKFMVTNVTKYVLDFYCPHCGGEISVSKNKNKGGIFGADQGTITINKGVRDPNESKSQTTSTPFSRETKT